MENLLIEAKKNRTKLLIKYLNENKGKSVQQILAIFCINSGVSMNKAKEYYNEIKVAGFLNE